MPQSKHVWKALFDTATEHASMLVIPFFSKQVSARFVRPLLGSAAAQTKGLARLMSYRAMSTVAVDGAVLDGAAANSWAKFAIPKGLPTDKERRLVIENEPHTLNETPELVIEQGYGAGVKKLVFAEDCIVKVKGTSFVSRVNYHFHEANVAGPHYDLVVEGLDQDAGDFELHVPRGEHAGRYSFVSTGQGMICLRMSDRSALLPKPDYKLLSVEQAGHMVGGDKHRYTIERKMDGSVGNCAIHEGRAHFRSHRESASPYTDKIPALEHLDNKSRFWSYRALFKSPNLTGTIFQGELLHDDGVARVSGILNAHPVKARQMQDLRGPVQYYVWDISSYKGRDVSQLPYAERRALYEEAVRDIRMVNRNWHCAQVFWEDFNSPKGVQVLYDVVTTDNRGLPFSEGLVIKDQTAPAGAQWFKVKHTDLEDFVVREVHSSPPGTKYSHSMSYMIVADPATGHESKVGAFKITDAERQWIYDNREDVIGSVAKIQVMEKTEAGAARAGVFVEFHGDARLEAAANEQALKMYSESLAGGDLEESERMLYRLKSSAGWRRA